VASSFESRSLRRNATAKVLCGPEWRYELKLDGYRAIGFSSEGQARLWSRNGKDFVRRFPEIATAIASLPEDTAIDDEIVALDAC
jgi:bifunctional non-homologous end joining protein LigD